MRRKSRPAHGKENEDHALAAAEAEARAALKASKGKKGAVSFGAIAAAHGVSRTTLRDRVKGHSGGAPRGAGGGRPTALPATAEAQLAAWVLQQQAASKSVGELAVLKEAKWLAGVHHRRFNTADGFPGRKWLGAFLQRHKLSLRVAVVRAQTKTASPEMLEKVEQFFEEYRRVLAAPCDARKRGPPKPFAACPHRILNADESGVQRCTGSSKVIVATGKC